MVNAVIAVRTNNMPGILTLRLGGATGLRKRLWKRIRFLLSPHTIDRLADERGLKTLPRCSSWASSSLSMRAALEAVQ